ncbi:MAG: phosphatase PAP2 family protein [Thermoplasmatota archaeon]
MQAERQTSRRPATAWIFLAISIVGLGLVSYGVATGTGIARYDVSVENWETPLSLPHQAVGTWGSLLGSQVVAIGALVIGALALWFWKRRGLALFILVFGALGEATAEAMKLLFHRARPTTIETDYAYPSGHAIRSVLDYGLLLFFVLPALVASRPGFARWRSPLLVLWLLLCIGVDFSRVAGGYHWFTDVVGGIFLGVALLSAAALAWTARPVRRGRPATSP